MAQETQDFFDEMKTPSIKTLGQAQADIRGFAPNIGAIKRQIALWLEELTGALLGETDAGLYEILKSEQQRLEIMQQGVDQVYAQYARLVEFGRLLTVDDAEARQYSTDNGLGYTI